MPRKRLPLYLSISRQIQRLIQKGELQPGDRLPTQRELAEKFDTTVMTIRQALDVLSAEDVIRTEHGIGTFVAPAREMGRNFHLMGFSHEMSQRAISIETEILGKEFAAHHDRAARLLKLPADADLVLLERRRWYSNKPIVYQRSYMAPWFRSIVEDYASPLSLYELFRSSANQVVGMTREVLEPVTLDDFSAEKLQTTAGTPAVLAIRSSFNANGDALIYDEALLAKDRVVVTTERVGQRTSMTFQLINENYNAVNEFLLEGD